MFMQPNSESLNLKSHWMNQWKQTVVLYDPKYTDCKNVKYLSYENKTQDANYSHSYGHLFLPVTTGHSKGRKPHSSEIRTYSTWKRLFYF